MIDRDLPENSVGNLCSALTWHGWLEAADVPTPETVFCDALTYVPPEDREGELEATVDADAVRECVADAPFDYPVFVRTDQAAAKHGFTNVHGGSRIDGPSDVADTVGDLLLGNQLAGIVGKPYRTLMLREWLPLAASFEAFGGTPIAPEVRVFVDAEAEEIQCYHFYWPKEAISRPDREDWEHLHDAMVHMALGKAQTERYLSYARKVAEEIPAGEWSVDFAYAENDHYDGGRLGEWYAIDAALAGPSWHPEECENA